MNRIVLARAGCARPGAKDKAFGGRRHKKDGNPLRARALPGVTRGDDGNDRA
ncbi:hypothetical protein [Burkholderia ubonensis]|uniref:hypothetical protein n=1 Tax=Burkholderia ubonensis TaxID=101571 RepID=UPI0012FC325A|nr:hypothetical protein [Burkholderia ubonensis]